MVGLDKEARQIQQYSGHIIEIHQVVKVARKCRITTPTLWARGGALYDCAAEVSRPPQHPQLTISAGRKAKKMLGQVLLAQRAPSSATVAPTALEVILEGDDEDQEYEDEGFADFDEGASAASSPEAGRDQAEPIDELSRRSSIDQEAEDESLQLLGPDGAADAEADDSFHFQRVTQVSEEDIEQLDDGDSIIDPHLEHAQSSELHQRTSSVAHQYTPSPGCSAHTPTSVGGSVRSATQEFVQPPLPVEPHSPCPVVNRPSAPVVIPFPCCLINHSSQPPAPGDHTPLPTAVQSPSLIQSPVPSVIQLPPIVEPDNLRPPPAQGRLRVIVWISRDNPTRLLRHIDEAQSAIARLTAHIIPAHQQSVKELEVELAAAVTQQQRQRQRLEVMTRQRRDRDASLGAFQEMLIDRPAREVAE